MKIDIKRVFHRLALLLVMLTTSVALYAQGGISGTVVDTKGTPVIGATVIVNGTNTGTVTNAKGEFTLNANSGTDITISYIGYKTVNTQLSQGIKVIISEDSTELEELVVVGYGMMKKETLTGAIAVVGEEMFQEKGNATNPIAALQGQVPGTFITRSSTAPGDEEWTINLRGNTSVNSSEPLIIIDGFACSSTDEMSLLNPNDIESMSFLKDGAAAIYGSSAAAGVILITTKKGSKDRITVDYNTSATFKYLGNAPDLASTKQYATMCIAATESAMETNSSYSGNAVFMNYYQLMLNYAGGLVDTSSTTLPFSGWSGLDDFPLYDDVDWYSSLWGSTWSTDHNISIAGGGEKSTYRVSLGFLYDGSQIQIGNNNSQRYSLRANNIYKLSDKVTWNSVISYERQQRVRASNISGALTSSIPQPGLPLTNINGDPYTWGDFESPYGALAQGGDNNTATDKITLNQQINYKPLDWLTASFSGAYSVKVANGESQVKAVDYYSYLGTYVMTTPTQENSSYTMSTATTSKYSTTGYLTAAKKFNKHDVSAMLGAQYEMNDYEIHGVKGTDIEEALSIVNGAGTVSISSSNAWQNATMSGFGRFNYAYDGRYLFEVNGRYDGSSKFESENRWAMFGGGSAAWRISEEPFLKDVSWIDNIKIRVSYAEMGTQAGIGNYDGTQLYNLNSNSGAYTGSGDEYLSTITTNGSFASTTRQWERIKTTNFGFDFGFMGNKFTGSVDVYRKINSNMLISIDLPSTLGDSAPDANVGKFMAQGYEFQLTYRNKIGRDFYYNVGATLSYSEDLLMEYEGTSTISAGYKSDRVGYGLSSFFGYQYAGKFKTQAEADEYVATYYEDNGCSMPTKLRAGDNRYVDVNGDGKIDTDDLVYIGSDTPPYSFSFNAGFSYRGLDVNAIFQGSIGRVIYNNGYYAVPCQAYFAGSTSASIGNTWTETNQDAYYAPYTFDGSINTYNYQSNSLTAQSGDYLRLKNLSIGYTFPESIIGYNGFIKNARVSVTGVDLWEITKMEDGWDPEAKTMATSTQRYPFMRSFTFGLNLTF